MKGNFPTLDDALGQYLRDPDFAREYYRTKVYADLAAEIYRRRKQIGLTQLELAERSGTYQTRISKLETGDLDARLSTLAAVAEGLGARLEIKLVERSLPERAGVLPLVGNAIE